MTRTAALRPGRVYDLDTARVVVHFVSSPALDGEPVRVELVLLLRDGVEQRLTLREGERFLIGPASWVLTGVDDFESENYVVRIVRIDGED